MRGYRYALSAALLSAATVGNLNTASAAQPQAVSLASQTHHRLFVLTDVEADPDDTQSLVRLLVYSNEIDIEGLAAVTSLSQPDRIAPDSIHTVINAYAKVRTNLLLHARGYPTAKQLHSIVYAGSPLYGKRGLGDGHSSPASEALIRALEKPDPRPLWVNAWGGVNVLAQALHTIKVTRPPEQAAALYAKLRVYTISDQDDTGPWIRQNFPGVFYIVSPGSWNAATWMGMTQRRPHSDLETISDGWLARNIQQGHGALGAVYPDVAYGLEGDTPAFLGLIPNGLNDLEHPNWGSWGGRYELYLPVEKGNPGGPSIPTPPETRPIWTNAEDRYAPSATETPPPALPGANPSVTPAFEVKDNYVTLWRWRTAFQNDFAARMDWTVMPYAKANHPPIVRLKASALTVKPGATIELNAAESRDPDGDSLSYDWFHYREAGTYTGTIELGRKERLDVIRGLRAPRVTKPETIHFIVAISDKGTPALTRYGRVIITVDPN